MKAELEKVLLAERKNKRQLAELRALRLKLTREQVAPDQKVLKMIDDEIAALLK